MLKKYINQKYKAETGKSNNEIQKKSYRGGQNYMDRVEGYVKKKGYDQIEELE